MGSEIKMPCPGRNDTAVLHGSFASDDTIPIDICRVSRVGASDVGTNRVAFIVPEKIRSYAE